MLPSKPSSECQLISDRQKFSEEVPPVFLYVLTYNRPLSIAAVQIIVPGSHEQRRLQEVPVRDLKERGVRLWVHELYPREELFGQCELIMISSDEPSEEFKMHFEADLGKPQYLFGISLSLFGTVISSAEDLIYYTFMVLNNIMIAEEEFPILFHQFEASLQRAELRPRGKMHRLVSMLDAFTRAEGNTFSIRSTFHILALYRLTNTPETSTEIASLIECIAPDLRMLLQISDKDIQETSVDSMFKCSRLLVPERWRDLQVILQEFGYPRQIAYLERSIQRDTPLSRIREVDTLDAFISIVISELTTDFGLATREFSSEINHLASLFLEEYNQEEEASNAIRLARADEKVYQFLSTTSLKYLMITETFCDKPPSKELRKFEVFFLYSGLTIEGDLFITSKYGSTQAEQVEWVTSFKPRESELWRGEFEAEEEEAVFHIDIHLRNGMLLQESEFRVIHSGSPSRCFVFDLVFKSPIVTKVIGKRVARKKTQLVAFLTHVLADPNCFRIASELVAALRTKQSKPNDQRGLQIVNATSELVSRGVIPQEEQVGLFSMLLLGIFPLSRDEITSHWSGLFKFGMMALGLALTHELESSPVGNFLSSGYFQILVNSLQSRTSNWLQILKHVPITSANSKTFADYFNTIHTSDAKYAAVTLISNMETNAFMKSLLQLTRHIGLFVSMIEELFASPNAGWKERELRKQVNDFIQKRKFSMQDMEPLIEVLSESSEQFQAFVKKSELPRCLSEVVVCDIEEKWLPVYAKLLLKDTWIIPTLDCKEFAKKLIFHYSFPLASTYLCLKPFFQDLAVLFDDWLRLPRTVDLVKWMAILDNNLCLLECEGIGQQHAKNAIMDMYVKCGQNDLKFMQLARDTTFKSKLLEAEYIDLFHLKLTDQLKNNKTLLSNSFLRGLALAAESCPAERALLHGFLSSALRVTIASTSEHIVRALVENPNDHNYWKTLFRLDYANNLPSVQACITSSVGLLESILSGEICYEYAVKLSDQSLQAALQEIFSEALAARNQGNSFPYWAKIQEWISVIEQRFARISALHNSLAAFLPGLRSIIETSNHYPTINAKATVRMLAAEPSPKLLCLLNVQSNYELYKCLPSFAKCVQQLGEMKESLNCNEINNFFSRTKQDFFTTLKRLNSQQKEAKLSLLLHLFTDDSDFSVKWSSLNTLLELKLGLRNISEECLKYFSLKKNLEKVCGALERCGEAIHFPTGPYLPACNHYLKILSDEQLTIAHFIDETKAILSTLEIGDYCDSVVAEILRLIGEGREQVQCLLRMSDGFLKSVAERQAIEKDLSMSQEHLDQILTFRNFAQKIFAVADFKLLHERILELVETPPYHSILNVIITCRSNWPILLRVKEEFRYLDKRTAEWMKVMLTSSEVLFQKKRGVHQVSVIIMQYGSPVRKTMSDLAKLHSFSDFILKSYRKDQSAEDLPLISAAFRIISLLFVITGKLSILESIGAPTLHYNGTHCKIAGNSSPEISTFAETVSKEVEDWTDIVVGSQMKSYPLTFLFGQHLWKIEKVFLRSDAVSEGEMYEARSWLSCLGVSIPQRQQVKVESPTERLSNLMALLQNRTRSGQDSSLQRQASIELDNSEVMSFETANVSIACLSLFTQCGQIPPKAHRVMICRETTLTCELQAFFLHCFTCSNSKQKLFVLVNYDLLSESVQRECAKLFERCLRDTSSISCLAFVAKNCKCFFAQYLLWKLKGRRVRKMTDRDLTGDGSWVCNANPWFTLVTSEMAGMGKTKWVEDYARNSRQKLSILRIDGDIDSETLCEDLCSLIVAGTAILLIQVGQIEESAWNTLSGFFLQLILLKSYKANEHFVVMPPWKVFVEVENTPSKDWVLRNTLLNFFPNQHFSNINLDNYLLTSESNAALLHLKELQESSASLFENVSENLEIDPVACKSIILHYFSAMLQNRIPISYRAINSFLNFIGSQLQRMNKSPLFALHQNEEASNLVSQRNLAMKMIIEAANQYSIQSVERIGKTQKTAKSMNERAEGFIDGIVAWGSCNTDLIIFNKDCEYRVIYKTESKVAPLLNQLLPKHSIKGKSGLGSSLPSIPQLIQTKLQFLLSHFCSTERQVHLRDFAVTPDSLLKMNLLYIRIQTKTPIVLLGETGCGKTSLVLFFIRELLGECLEVIRCDEKLTKEMLIEQFNVVASHCKDSQTTFVLFDDFNASSCTQLIAQIVCDRKLLGNRIPENISLLATCNPYRTKSNSELAYNVTPIPPSMIEFVWDFGGLLDSDIHDYAAAIMASTGIPEHLIAENIATLLKTHQFLASKDQSCVSLRDVKRLATFFHWFCAAPWQHSTLPETHLKSESPPKIRFKNATPVLSNEQKARYIAFYMCYAARFSDKSLRNDSLRCIARDNENPVHIVRVEQQDLISRMLVPEHVIVNTALLESVFAICVAINSKIPVILRGPPGCGKTMAVDLVFSNYKETTYIIPIRGWKGCSAESVRASFDRAKSMQSSQNRTPVIVFEAIDKVGPSVSRVLQEELETFAVAFVGISNAQLGANAMNRVLHVAIPHPSSEELTTMCLELYSQATEQKNRIHDCVFEDIVKAYFELQKSSANKLLSLRDLYSLISRISESFRHSLPKNDQEMATMLKDAIDERAGALGTPSDFWNTFINFHHQLFRFRAIPNTSMFDLLKANWSRASRRPLLIQSESEVLALVLSKEPNWSSCDLRNIIGSTFSSDLHSGTYTCRLVSEILACMAIGCTLVLKDANQACSALCDLLDQRVELTLQGKLCRVTLGSLCIQNCFVHENFRLIVVTDENGSESLDESSSLFSRFEKVTVDLGQMLDTNQRQTVNAVQLWVNELVESQKTHLSQAYLFPTYNLTYVQMQVFSGLSLSEVKQKLLEAAPVDVLLLTGLQIRADTETEQFWRKVHSDPLSEVIAQSSQLILIYTCDAGGDFTAAFPVPARFRWVTEFQSESDLKKDVEEFISSKGAQLYFLGLNCTTDRRHLLFVKFCFEEFSRKHRSQLAETDKKLCIVVTMERNVSVSSLTSDYSQWRVYSSDNLCMDVFSQDKVSSGTTSTLISNPSIFPFNQVIRPLFDGALSRLEDSEHTLNIKKQAAGLEEDCVSDTELAMAFQQQIVRYLESENIRLNRNWKERLFTDTACVNQCSTLHSAIFKVVEGIAQEALASVLSVLEAQGLLSSLFTFWGEQEGLIIREIWISNLGNMSEDYKRHSMSSTLVLNFPFSMREYELLREPFSDTEAFLKAFQSRSVVSNHLKVMTSKERLQHVYFLDLICIHLQLQHLPSDLAQVFFSALWFIFLGQPAFYFRVWVFNQCLGFLTTYCKCVFLNAQFRDTPATSLLKTFISPEGLVDYPEYLREERPRKAASRPSSAKFKDIDDPYTDASGLLNKDAVLSRKQQLLQRLDAALLSILPDKGTLQCQKEDEWKTWLLRFQREYLDFNEKLVNLNMLQLLIRLGQVGDSSIGLDFFIDVCSDLRHLKLEGSNPLIDDEKLINKIMRKLEPLERKHLREANVFKTYYYSELFEKDATRVAAFARDITQQADFWRTASPTIEVLFVQSGLKTACKDFLSTREFKVHSNPWILAIEGILDQDRDLSSNFAVLMSDWSHSLYPSSGRFSEKLFVSYVKHFRICMDIIYESNTLAFPQTFKLLSFAFTRWFLEFYCWILLSSTECTYLSEPTRQTVESWLEMKSEFPVTTLRIYCLKQLYIRLERNREGLLDFIRSKCEVRWIREEKDLLERTEAKRLYLQVKSDVFTKTSDWLELFSQPGSKSEIKTKFTELLTMITDADAKVQFGFAVLFHTDILDPSHGVRSEIKKYLSNKQFKATMEPVMVSLLLSLVTNFESSSLLRITSKCSEPTRHHLVCVHAFLVVVTAYCRSPGCLTSIFFDTSSGTPSTTAFNSLFVAGAAHEPLYEYLYLLKVNPMRYAEDLWFTCGNCAYIYPAMSCSIWWSEMSCPYCAAKIGGKGPNDIIQRKGHSEISESSVVSEAEAQVNLYYESLQKPGLEYVKANFDAAEMRGISKLAYVLLNYFVNWYLCFLYSIEPKIVEKMVPLRDGFKSHVDYFTRTMTSGRSTLDNLMSSPENYLFLYKVVSNLSDFLKISIAIPTTPKIRQHFEMAFFETLVKNDSKNLSAALSEYKSSLPFHTVPLYEEYEHQVKTIPFIRLFRVTRTASMELLQSSWNLKPAVKKYPILSFFMERITDFRALKHMIPVIQLANFMINKFNHSINRKTAYTTPIETLFEKREDLRQLFSSFCEAWREISFKLSYLCHPLEKRTFNSKDEVMCFLMDERDQSLGLYLPAALASFANKQNNLMKQFTKTIVQAQQMRKDLVINPHRVSVQLAEPSHLLSYIIEDSTFLQPCFASNPQYGTGEEISFDYQAVERQLIKYVYNARRLRFEDLRFFTFKFELLSLNSPYSNLITSIRKAVPQSPLPDHSPISSLMSISIFHSEFEFVLCAIPGRQWDSSTTVEDVVKKLEITSCCKNILKTQEIAHLPIASVVAAYEQLEELLFNEVCRYLKPLYYSESREHEECVRTMLTEIDQNSSALPFRIDVEKALKRFVVRCLSAQPMSSEKLGLYIEREDLWDESVTDQQRAAVSSRLSTVPLEFTLQVCETLLGIKRVQKIHVEEVKPIVTKEQQIVREAVVAQAVVKQKESKVQVGPPPEERTSNCELF